MHAPKMPDGYPRIDDPEESVLAHEIHFQVWSAQWAFDQLAVGLRGMRAASALGGEPGTSSGGPVSKPEVGALLNAFVGPQVLLWSMVRQILSAASVVSLILWPITERPPQGAREKARVARAEKLRKRWNLGATSVLADRDVRDVFEHVDEKLVEWLDDMKSDRLIGLSVREVPPEGVNDGGETFRVLDPKTLVVWAGGKKCDLGVIVGELKAIALKLPPTTHVMDVGVPERR